MLLKRSLEIQDEHDEDEDWVEQKIDKNKYILSARHEIENLNDEHGWGIPEGDYDTLGGFILSITEDIPEVNDIIEYDHFEIKIITMEDARIDNVLFTYKKPEED